MILAGLCLVLICVAAKSTTLYVSPFGSDSFGDGSFSSPYETLDKGVSECYSRNVASLALMDGAYTAPTVSIHDGLSILSASYNSANVIISPDTETDGVESSSTTNGVFQVDSDAAVQFSAITIARASNSGIYGGAGSDVSVDSCNFLNNNYAIDLNGEMTYLNVVNSTFANGSVANVHIHGGSSANQKIFVVDSKFNGGYSIHTEGDNAEIRAGNCTTTSGGFLYQVGAKADVRLQDLVISGQSGGPSAITMLQSSSAEDLSLGLAQPATANKRSVQPLESVESIESVESVGGTTQSNLVFDTVSVTGGGYFGVYIDGAKVKGLNLDIYGALGVGLFCSNAHVTIQNLSVSSTSSYKAQNGGGLHIQNSIFAGQGVSLTQNTASNGGGLWCDQSTVNLQSLTITDNKAYGYAGSAFCSSTCTVLATGITQSGNTSGTAGNVCPGFM